MRFVLKVLYTQKGRSYVIQKIYLAKRNLEINDTTGMHESFDKYACVCVSEREYKVMHICMYTCISKHIFWRVLSHHLEVPLETETSI